MAGIRAKLLSAGAKLRLAALHHHRRAGFYVRANLLWLWDARHFGLAASGTVGVPVVVLGWFPQEYLIRDAGLFLQIVGILTVWWGIRGTRKLFQHPTFWMQAREWIRRRPRYEVRVVGLAGSVIASTSGSARLTVWSSAGPAATLERRIEALEENLIRVRDDAIRFQSSIEEEVRNQTHALAQAVTERKLADEEIQKTLRSAETGGLHISAIGAWFLLIGVIMGTIPDILASWLQSPR